MKIYSCPKEVPAPTVDYVNYNHTVESAKEKSHMEALAEWLRKQGFTGAHTGGILSLGVADGSANYMLADGRKSFLVHLPYGDAYQSRDVGFLPKKEVIRRIEAEKKFSEAFAQKVLTSQ